MVDEMYKNVTHGHKPKKEIKLPVIISLGVAMLATITFLISAMMRTQYIYNRYKAVLVECVVSARESGAIGVYEGEQLVNSVEPKKLFNVLAGIGHGRPIKASPEDPPDITVSLGGNGSVSLWQSTFADYSQGKGADYVPGIILSFKSEEGFQYICENDGDFDHLRSYLLGEIEDYYDTPEPPTIEVVPPKR